MDSQAKHSGRKTDRDSHAGRTSFVTTQDGDNHHGTVTGHDSGDAYLTSPSGDSTDSMRVSGLGKGPHAQKGGMFGVGTRQVVTTTKDAQGKKSTGMVPYNESVHGEWKGK